MENKLSNFQILLCNLAVTLGKTLEEIGQLSTDELTIWKKYNDEIMPLDPRINQMILYRMMFLYMKVNFKDINDINDILPEYLKIKDESSPQLSDKEIKRMKLKMFAEIINKRKHK